MFKFSCLYMYYSGSGSIMISPRDREGGDRDSFVSFPNEKKTKNSALSFSLTLSVSPFYLFSPTPPSPSRFPPQIRIHPYLSSRGEEESRAPQPPSLGKRRQRTARRPSLLNCPCCRSLRPSYLLVPFLLPLLPPPIPPTFT